MIVYHYSPTLKEGDRLEPGYQNYTDLCEPFIQALEHSQDCFYGMLLNGKYLFAVMNRSHLRYWADYAKWATEGLLEYVRRHEYPQCVSRLRCNYFCSELDACIRMYREDWGEETEEEQKKVHLFEVEIPENALDRRDMSVFDAVYDALNQKQEIAAALRYAREYFSGGHTEQPNWEYLSDADAKAVKDISFYLGKPN